MIQINLLPPELRPKPKVFEFSKEYALLAGIGVFVILFSIYFFLAILDGFQQQSLKKWLRVKFQMESSFQEVSQLKKKIQALQNQAAWVKKMTAQPLLWSQKLNQISDLLQPGTWLTQLTLQKSTLSVEGEKSASGTMLILKGRAYSRTKEEPALVGRYLSALKAEANFFGHFKDIQLENISGVDLGGIAVAEFQLVCPVSMEEKK